MSPSFVAVAPGARSLQIHWDGEAVANIPATTLREQARDSATLRQLHDFNEFHADPAIEITQLQLVGRMGVNLHFSDGSDRAIYPWPYLRKIAADLGN